MTVQQLTEALSLTVFNLDDPDRPVTGGYCGDLLSWVMGRAPADGVWLTIMSNVNVAAVDDCIFKVRERMQHMAGASGADGYLPAPFRRHLNDLPPQPDDN